MSNAPAVICTRSFSSWATPTCCWVRRAPLRAAGHEVIADRLECELVGRNVLYGRWTFQVIEEFDDNYWSVFRDHERRVREELQQGPATSSRPR